MGGSDMIRKKSCIFEKNPVAAVKRGRRWGRQNGSRETCEKAGPGKRDGCGLGWGLRTWRRTPPGAGVRLDAKGGDRGGRDDFWVFELQDWMGAGAIHGGGGSTSQPQTWLVCAFGILKRRWPAGRYRFAAWRGG